MTGKMKTLKRKVLLRDDFGLCVSWPKTLWGDVASPGKSCDVEIDGARRRVKLHTERCNCRGKGWHEHRFLSLPASAGAKSSDVVAVGVQAPDDWRPPAALSVSAAIDEINEANLFGRAMSAAHRRRLSDFLARRQGLPGAYAGLFAPVEGEISRGYRVFTGERMTSGGGARHILGEEALRAMVLLEQADPSARGRTLRRVAIEQASESMVQRLAQHEARPSGSGKGFYCCNRCSIALWRTLTVGGLNRAEERLVCGLRGLRKRRDGAGAWRGFPFAYTLSALIEIQLDEARSELRYTRPAIERRLAIGRKSQDIYATRRLALAEQALALLK